MCGKNVKNLVKLFERKEECKCWSCLWKCMDRCENVLPNKLKENKSGSVGDVCGNVWIGVGKK